MSENDQHIYKDRYMLRLPDGMRDRIKQAASKNGRSMNAEIVSALLKAYPPKKIDVEVLSELLSTLWGGSAPDGDQENLDLLNSMLAKTEQPWTIESGWDGRIIFYPYATEDGKAQLPRRKPDTEETG